MQRNKFFTSTTAKSHSRQPRHGSHRGDVVISRDHRYHSCRGGMKIAGRHTDHWAISHLASAYSSHNPQDAFSLLSDRSVFWEYMWARRVSERKNKIMHFRGFHSGGPELLNQVFGAARISTDEKEHLQLLAEGGSLEAGGIIESSLSKSRLSNEDDFTSSTSAEASNAAHCPDMSFFNDAFFMLGNAESS
ncbi:hypothetical protein L207DRAFT_630353 [Hyaloscypha variabilis F]|uniref:Uncharacterized protein n=1 Tax=Hyaloscypha variabilis (strain UAMH 11265 / GT02V1 / F) TaxID=1149755 RepID=A0A2J6RZL6_HYAVF|nr:hypothetical protein L207DRAFT_630353 [Hyaloscypha variabilis F]